MAKVTTKKTALKVGLGIAAAAAAGAGYYFYGSKSAAANRKKASGWAVKLHAEVKKGALKLKKFDQKAYATIVDEATKAYHSVKSIDKKELASVAKELKQNWKRVEGELSRTAKTGAKSAVKTAKKAVRVVKKSVAPRKVAKKVVAKKKS